MTALNSSSFVCEENGIKRLRTVAGTPQQNGVAERMNQTLCQRARREFTLVCQRSFGQRQSALLPI